MKETAIFSSGEGYIKFVEEYRPAPAVDPLNWKELNEGRTRLYDLGLIGSLPNGVGFGNVSIRLEGGAFLISGTATGGRRVLGPQDYCVVESFCLEENRVTVSGPVRASSESMTHGAVYSFCTSAMCVIHIHSRKIFNAMLGDGSPSTPAEASYGTPELALAVASLAAEGENAGGVMVLAGHDEGALAYGPSVRETMELILALYDKYAFNI